MTRHALNWFEIPATDIDRAPRFYEAVLGLPMHRETMGTEQMALFACDGDNAVTVFDYNMLSAAFDSVPGSPNWNSNADLDGDKVVTVFDYNILSANFDKTGDS